VHRSRSRKVLESSAFRVISKRGFIKAMSEKVDVAADLPDEVEAAVQKIAVHTGYTRDEIIERCVKWILDAADAPPGPIEKPDFLALFARALKGPNP